MFSRFQSTPTHRKGYGFYEEWPVVVDRVVKELLNSLIMERFDSISDQIIAWANKSEKEKDGRTLIQVIQLVFEKATDAQMSSEIYARLCRKMMEQISPKVQDYRIMNSEGMPIAGGNLFRRYLLNRCQEGFEIGWVASATATGATDVQAVKRGRRKPSEMRTSFMRRSRQNVVDWPLSVSSASSSRYRC